MKIKRFLKRMIPLFCFTFLVSCGTDAANVTQIDSEPSAPALSAQGASQEADSNGGADVGGLGSEITDVLNEITDDVSVRGGEEAMEITWGYNNIPGQDFSNVKLPDDSEVIKALNGQFNVVLKGVMIPYENNMYYGNWESVNPLPDVLTVSGDAEYAYGTGNFRTVPHEMVERYAPNLAAALNSNPDGWAANNSVADATEFLGLGYCSEGSQQLSQYSAYRLDWLEAEGFELPDDMVEISPGQYFSPTPFTLDKFYEAMRAVMNATAATAEHYGFAFPMSNDIRSVLFSDLPNVANMFGLNENNMNDGGKVNMYYATQGYKSLLEFMADMYEQGFCAVKGTSETEYSGGGVSGTADDGGKNQMYEVGYWNEFTSMLVNDDAWYSTGRILIDAIPGAKILYVPPEKHIPFETLDSLSTDSVFNFYSSKSDLIMVNKNVSDEKLAVILNIYDTCAFDPETKVLATYGIEGANFEWAGEPYNSFVREIPTDESPSYNNSTNLLSPPVMGGPAYNPFYEENINPNNPVYLHSKTLDALAMRVPEYKDMLTGEFNSELIQWQENRYADVRDVYTGYFYEIVLGEADTSSTWDDYLNRLYAAGLTEYLEILDKLPTLE